MTEYLTAARGGDWDTAYGYFADDMQIRIPGRSEWAGERQGKQHAVDYIQAARERFHGDGGPLEIRRANVYTVRDDKIVEIAIFEGDQYVVDALLH